MATKKQAKREIIRVALSPETYLKLKGICTKKERSVNYVVNQLITKLVN